MHDQPGKPRNKFCGPHIRETAISLWRKGILASRWISVLVSLIKTLEEKSGTLELVFSSLQQSLQYIYFSHLTNYGMRINTIYTTFQEFTAWHYLVHWYLWKLLALTCYRQLSAATVRIYRNVKRRSSTRRAESCGAARRASLNICKRDSYATGNPRVISAS